MKTTTFKDYKARQMKEPGVSRAWQELEEEFEMLESILKLRERAGMSQDVLAKKAGISRSVYSRLAARRVQERISCNPAKDRRGARCPSCRAHRP